LPANNTIQSHFKHNSESNIVPTAGAFGTFACQVWKGIMDFNSVSEENAKNIHNCSVADKLSLYKSSNKKLPVGINKQRQLA
jgi:hypothetical protein